MTETTQRCHLTQFWPVQEEVVQEDPGAKKKKKGEEEVVDEEGNIFGDAGSYVYIRIKITPPINPLVNKILPIIPEIAPIEEQK